MAQASIEGLDDDGGLWYEYEPGENHLIKQKHSWPQAEAMIGFFNAWQITGDEKYLNYSTNAWKFTQQYILDKEGGEWVWGVNEDYSVMNEEDKVGIWKCPYHNSRACIEIMRRIDRQLK
jgi:mannobiose 2-epimerase